MQRVRLAAGLLLALGGAVLVFMPLEVAAALNRPHDTPTLMINLRASWGGVLLGIGAFVAWIDAVRPRRRFVLGLLMWTMLGIFAGRLVGFVLDGSPDAWQWVWLIAELVIAGACGYALSRQKAAPEPSG